MSEISFDSLRERCQRIARHATTRPRLTKLAQETFASERVHVSEPLMDEGDEAVAACWLFAVAKTSLPAGTLDTRSIFGPDAPINHAGAMSEAVLTMTLSDDNDLLTYDQREALHRYLDAWEAEIKAAEDQPVSAVTVAAPVTEPATATIRPAWLNALSASEHAQNEAGRELTAEEAWEWLYANGTDDIPGVNNYELPLVGSFKTYLSKARKAVRESRNSSRSGRVGRSAIPEGQL